MNKGELIEKIAKDAKITKSQAGDALDSFINAVGATLSKGGKPEGIIREIVRSLGKVSRFRQSLGSGWSSLREGIPRAGRRRVLRMAGRLRVVGVIDLACPPA